MNLIELSKEFGSRHHYTKKAIVFNQGDSDNFIYIITKGVLKGHYQAQDGKEYIKSFLFAGDSIASLQALHGGRCSFSLLCLQDVELLKIPYPKVREYAEKDLNTANAIIELLIAFAMKKEQREYELLCLDAEQRYLNLLARNADITQHVTQNDIARYLGITPVALSRIKNKKGK
jgi:CRP-like cAMP-binding protein